MDKCLSMYLGNILVYANDPGIDYNSYRDLGLICPFCHEPVFYRQGGVKVKNGKQVIYQPAFVHFPSKDLRDFKECELRCISPEWKGYLKTLTKDAKNQRLRLFNRRFWEMIRENFPEYPEKPRKVVLKHFSEDAYYECYRNIRKTWPLPRTLKSIETIIESLFRLKLDGKQTSKNINTVKSDVNTYLKVHKIICTEAYNFTCSQAGQEALEQMFAAAYYFKKITLTNFLKEIPREIKKTFEESETIFNLEAEDIPIFASMIIQIAMSDWQKTIEIFLQRGQLGFA